MQYDSVNGPQKASFVKPLPVTAGADARGGALKQIVMTLVTANQVYQATLPAGVRGFRLYPNVADVVFAVGESPAALATLNTNAVAANFSIGETARAFDYTTRILDDFISAAGANVFLRSATANANVFVSTF